MDIYQARIEKLKELIGPSSLKNFAEQHDLDASHLSQLLNGHRKMGERAAANLEAKIGLAEGTLRSPEGSSYLAEDGPQLTGMSQEKRARRMLPVIGYVQAGEFCEAIDNFQPGDAEEWMEAYGAAGPHAFILRVEGISMDPDFRPGDLVVIDPDSQWRTGDFVVAKRASDQAVTLKQIRCEGNRYYLYATNPHWPQRIIEMDEEWHICGRVRRKITEY